MLYHRVVTKNALQGKFGALELIYRGVVKGEKTVERVLAVQDRRFIDHDWQLRCAHNRFGIVRSGLVITVLNETAANQLIADNAPARPLAFGLPEFRGRTVTGVILDSGCAVLQLHYNGKIIYAMLNVEQTEFLLSVLPSCMPRMQQAEKLVRFLRFNGWDSTGCFIGFNGDQEHQLDSSTTTGADMLVRVRDFAHARQLFGNDWHYVCDRLKPSKLFAWAGGVYDMA